MKRHTCPLQLAVTLLVLAGSLCPARLLAANTVAPPNVLWHNQVTGANRVWIMNGSSFSSEITLPPTSDDLGWKMVGSGDFNGDGKPDLLWQNQITGQNAVWLMNGTTVNAGALIQSAGDLNWRLAGVADFNGDGKPDLLWQNLSLGQNAVWLMNGTTPSSYNLIPSAGDPNWKIVAAGDLNRDGKPDIILRNQSTGQNAVWFMNGLSMISGEMLRSSGGAEASETDQDWQIVGTADYNGDGRPDLLWRHSTLGLNVCWYLSGAVVTSTGYLGRQEFDTDWKAASQDTATSTWRLRTASYTWLRAAVSTSPAKVVLTFKLPAISGPGVTIQRRLMSETSWTTLVKGVQAQSYTDSAVSLGRAYEYRAYQEGFMGSQASAAEHVCAALNAPPTEDRGRIILLVDQTLSPQIGASLDQLKQDLVGDGWSVLRYDVPRHIDDYSSATSFLPNAYNITNVIKPLIRSAYASNANTRAVLIVGHVAIPYSGTFNPDGHSCGPPQAGPDHRGAWPADMFYGDLDGVWTDKTANIINCSFPEPNNVPGDGKFDQEGIPPPLMMKLAVGRIDFARLPAFTQTPPPGIAPKSEAALIQQYLSKDHRYRLKLLGWQKDAPERAMVYGNFHDSRDNPIFENAAQALAGITDNPGGLLVGDFCLQRSQPNLWGFLSGSGSPDRVNSAIPYLEHTALDLADPAKEPKTAFCMALASFVGDWNLSNNNYLRSLLATPNFGLASMWVRLGLWRTDCLGLGETLGASLVRMVNDPKNTFYDTSRDLAILGDPALRLHVLTPPASLIAASNQTKSAVQLSWAASEPGAQYYVYRGDSSMGPFTRISPSPISTTTFTDTATNPKQKAYMVRAIKGRTTGTGSYTNISQGAFATAN